MGHKLDTLRALSGDRRAKDSHLILAQLIADGFQVEEVLPFLVAKPTHKQQEAIPQMASLIYTMVPYLDQLVKIILDGKPKLPSVDSTGAEPADDFDLDTSSKESVLKHLKAQYKEATDVKQKSDILMKIADLQKMKQDEIKDEQRHTMVYLPATCHDCPCMLEVQKEHPDIKPLSQC